VVFYDETLSQDREESGRVWDYTYKTIQQSCLFDMGIDSSVLPSLRSGRHQVHLSWDLFHIKSAARMSCAFDLYIELQYHWAMITS